MFLSSLWYADGDHHSGDQREHELGDHDDEQHACGGAPARADPSVTIRIVADDVKAALPADAGTPTLTCDDRTWRRSMAVSDSRQRLSVASVMMEP